MINIKKNTGTTCTTAKKNRSINWIVLHYTASTSSYSGYAKAITDEVKNGGLKGAADYYVDDGNIIQYNPDIKNRYCHHCGDSKYSSVTTSLGAKYYGKCTNENSIGVEMASNKTNKKSLGSKDTDWYFTEATLNNALQLVNYLMQQYNIDTDHVIMHHMVSGKICPNPWVVSESRLSGYYNFIKQLGGTAKSSGKSSDDTMTIKDINLVVFGKNKTIKGYTYDGLTYVQVSVLLDFLGYKYSFDKNTKRVTAIKGDNKILLATATAIRDNISYCAIRNVCTLLGYTCSYDTSKGIVIDGNGSIDTGSGNGAWSDKMQNGIIEWHLYHNKSGTDSRDCIEIANNIKWNESLSSFGQAISFDILNYNSQKFINAPRIDTGDIFQLYADNLEIIRAVVTGFNVKKNIVSVTCKDFSFYLKTELCKQIKNAAADKAIKDICTWSGITVGDICTMSYTIDGIFCQSALSMIDDVLTKQRQTDGKMRLKEFRGAKLYIMQYPTEPLNMSFKLASNVAEFEPWSDCHGYMELSQNMDSRYTAVRAYSKSESNYIENMFVARDDDAVKQKGLIVKNLEVSRFDRNNIGLNLIAQQELSINNRDEISYNVSLPGCVEARAGRVVNIINDETGTGGNYRIESVTHSLKSGVHTMDCTVTPVSNENFAREYSEYKTSDVNTKTNSNESSTPLKTIKLPKDNMGNVFTQMAWRKITSESSSQMKLKKQSGEHYDSEGFAVINGRYVVAMTKVFGEIGDYVNVHQSNGNVIKCIIGDRKDETSAHGKPADKYGHTYGTYCDNVLEFIMKETKANNPGEKSNHKSWKFDNSGNRIYVTKVENYGNYFDGVNPDSAGSNNSAVNALLNKARSLKGKVKYGYGSNGPNSYDCSHFVYWAFSNCGYKSKLTSYTTAINLATIGTKVTSPKAGDVCVFKNKGSNHCGIYSGNGNMIHCNASDDTVSENAVSKGGNLYGYYRMW